MSRTSGLSSAHSADWLFYKRSLATPNTSSAEASPSSFPHMSVAPSSPIYRLSPLTIRPGRLRRSVLRRHLRATCATTVINRWPLHLRAHWRHRLQDLQLDAPSGDDLGSQQPRDRHRRCRHAANQNHAPTCRSNGADPHRRCRCEGAGLVLPACRAAVVSHDTGGGAAAE